MAGIRGHYRSKSTPSKARVLAIAEFCAAKDIKVSNREIFKAENVAESTGRQWLKQAREPRQKITDPAHPDFREHGNRRLTIDDVARIEQMLYSGGPDIRMLPWERLPDAAGCLFEGRSKPSGATVRRVMHQKDWKKCTACRWLVHPGTTAGTCGCGTKVPDTTEPQGLNPGPGVGDAQIGGVPARDGVQVGHVQADQGQADQVQADQVQMVPVQADQVQTDPVQADQVQADPAQADQVQADPVQAGQVQVDPPGQADPAEVVHAQADPTEVEHVQAEHLLHVEGVPQWPS